MGYPGAHCGLLLAVRRDVGDDFGPVGHIFELVGLLLLLGTWSRARTSDPILRNLLVNIHVEEIEASWYCNCLGRPSFATGSSSRCLAITRGRESHYMPC